MNRWPSINRQNTYLCNAMVLSIHMVVLQLAGHIVSTTGCSQYAAELKLTLYCVSMCDWYAGGVRMKNKNQDKKNPAADAAAKSADSPKAVAVAEELESSVLAEPNGSAADLAADPACPGDDQEAAGAAI